MASNIYNELRSRVFASTPEEIGISCFTPNHKIWCVVMEVGLRGNSFSLIAMIDGNASIYFSNGGGIIGGIGHEQVRLRANEFNHSADTSFGYFQRHDSKTYFLPKTGEVIFYVITKNGVFSAKASEADLDKNRHALSSVFMAANTVITELRLIEERARKIRTK